MGNYYDYRGYFESLETNTETIIENQENMNRDINKLIDSINVLVFVTVLMFATAIVRKVVKS